MAAALAEAQAAAREGEVPVGCVVALDGRVIAADHNRTIQLGDPTAHAEILAIRRAAAAVGNHRLTRCELAVTLEPCAMCVGACVQARLHRVIYGCADPRWGALGSRLDLGRPGLFNHDLAVAGGILADACRELLQEFFRSRRGRRPTDESSKDGPCASF
ncbi:MAG TPA: tRNA adenosine(34) deaminase TadA [Acidobacteriota bacterium]|nr:nucleoside deaminase [Acidobacteriota bacterium]HQF87596.1 tRNA adenosine(34) deaminase TadA [Acidobacteriota bacterium]HQG92601.1 tRNA adenosine(34) deaminase TadA [Acidobacteriota bacterium]